MNLNALRTKKYYYIYMRKLVMMKKKVNVRMMKSSISRSSQNRKMREIHVRLGDNSFEVISTSKLKTFENYQQRAMMTIIRQYGLE
jgi:hypothetical protein